MDFTGLSLALFEKISNARDALSLSPLLSAIEEDTQMNLVNSTQVFAECPLNIDNPEESTRALHTQIDGLLNDTESEFAKVVLDRHVTHATVKLSDDNNILRTTIRVFYHYCEIDPVGEFIDGDLVLQGSSIRDNYGPAFCTLQYAPSEGEEYTEINVVAPWSFMLTASEGDAAAGDVPHKAAQFMIPISVASEYQLGVVRIQIYVDTLDQIPYDEQPLNESGECTYDMHSAAKRSGMVCAAVIVKQCVPADGHRSPTTTEGAAAMVAEGEPGSARSGIRSQAEEAVASLRGSRRGSENSLQPGAAATKSEHGGEVGVPGETEDAEVSALFPGGKEDDFDPVDSPSHSPVRTQTRSVTPAAYAADAQLLEQTAGFITDIRIASDYDDLLALQSEGYEVHCTVVDATGPLSDQEHLWKFHVMATYGTGHETTGLEDITWVKCLKSLGTLPTVPLFQIMHDYDLSEEDDDYAIYLAYKVGPNPRFKRLLMLSAAIEDEKHLTAYINAFTAVFRPAPANMAKAFGGPCGILLMIDAHPVQEVTKSRKNTIRDGAKAGEHGKAVDDASAGGSRSAAESDVEDESEDEESEDEEEHMASMMQRLEELLAEKAGLVGLNKELQKKAIALIAREKAMQGQTAAARTAAEVVATLATENPEAALEQNIEKDKQYQDTLGLIVEERHKLNKQLKEFDQLALDLQTRLDDKELKANSIQLSFKQFKKEILSKAENSRTGQGITARQMQHFETSELKHEEDLERVRLRNISLRTMYRKLERTLRAREQLAEGLHMIDFEQLKIENQTLNEKIEERNEDLAKLKRKKTTTVQVLTHIREKLRFIEQENEVLAEKLAGLDNATTELRNIVTSDKLYRDSQRAENKELKAKQGFATSDLLLVDYEGRCAKVEQLKAATTELKDRYGILMRQVNRSTKSSSSTPWMMSSSNVMK